MTLSYDADGNMISEIGKIGTDKVETYYAYAVENRLAAVYEADELLVAMAYDGDGNRVFQLNYNLHTDEDWKANSGNGNGSNKDNSGSGNSSSDSGSTNSTSNGSGNTTNVEENTSQNQSGILFPVDSEVSDTEQGLIDLIKTTGKQKNYELIEYINDVNREYAEVLVEQNINGKTDTSYVYGVDRLSLDRFDGSTGYYLYDQRGSVTGITNEEGQLYQSYRYGAYGEITFGTPQYENEYTYNGESYNPNIESQYLRARYYYVVTATFLTEDSYLGNIVEPLTLNRYVYCVASPLNYVDPSGHFIINWKEVQRLSKEFLEDNKDEIIQWGIKNVLNPDDEGEELILNYLYGEEKEIYIDTWGDYMMANEVFAQHVSQYIIPIGNSLALGESIEVDTKINIIILKEGSQYLGYNLLYGSNADAGGFQAIGVISKGKDGTIRYEMSYIFNDIMDPNYDYIGDKKKEAILKSLKDFCGFTLNEYTVHVSWNDVTIISPSGSNEGWLSVYQQDYLYNLEMAIRIDKASAYSRNEDEINLGKNYLERLKKWKEDNQHYFK